MDARSIGVLYFLVEDRKNDYFNMAVRSVQSIRRHMPWLKFTLFVGKELDEGLDLSAFDTVIYAEPDKTRKKWIWSYKYDCLLSSPYDVTLHLDSDTFACDDFSEVFEMMDRFDFVSTLSPHYGMEELNLHGAPSCFPEIAGGFMLWRKNDITTKWLELIRERLPAISYKRADEPAIRWAIWDTVELRYAIIPWEYTCVYQHPGYLQYKVKIMHGKDKYLNETIEEAVALFNKEPITKRVYTGEQLFKLKKVRKRFMGVDEVIPYGHWKKQDSDENKKEKSRESTDNT